MKAKKIAAKVVAVFFIASTMIASLPTAEGLENPSAVCSLKDSPVMSSGGAGEPQQQHGHTETHQLLGSSQSSPGQIQRPNPGGTARASEKVEPTVMAGNTETAGRLRILDRIRALERMRTLERMKTLQRMRTLERIRTLQRIGTLMRVRTFERARMLMRIRTLACIRTLLRTRAHNHPNYPTPTTTPTPTPTPTPTKMSAAAVTPTPTPDPEALGIKPAAPSPPGTVLADTSVDVSSDEETEKLLREIELLAAHLRRVEQVIGDKKEALRQAEAELQELKTKLGDEVSDDKALQDQIAHIEGVANGLRSEIADLEAQRNSLTNRLNAQYEKLYIAMLKALTVLEQALQEEIMEKGDILRWQVILGFLTMGVMILAIVTDVFDTEILKVLRRAFRKKSGSTLVDLTSPVSAGAIVTLTIEVAAGTRCTPYVIDQSGQASTGGLESKTADTSGRVSWAWQVHPSATPGTWMVCVDCDPGGSTQWPFVVEENGA